MKVPNHIKKAIRLKGKHNVIRYNNDVIIRNWLSEQGMYNDTMLDNLIDCTEQATNNADILIDLLERENFEEHIKRNGYRTDEDY
jgi:hypothetical protein